MSGLFNRLKSRKTGSNNTSAITTSTESEPTTPACAFDEEGFLCPICHQKFNDQTELAQHYADTHAQDTGKEKENTNSVQNGTKQEDKQEGVNKKADLWKQQFIISEESRILLSTELMQQKQRADDLEEELQLLQKHLKLTQTKAAEQSMDIANLKAAKDIYDAQLTICTNELLNTQNELKEKQHQITTLCNDLLPRSTNDDVDVLKRELVTVQQRMNEISIEKEQQIEKLRVVLIENYQSVQKLDPIETIFNQNLLIYDELISNITAQLASEIKQIKQCVKVARERKEKLENTTKDMRRCLMQNQSVVEQLKQANTQLHTDLEQQKHSINTLTNDLQIEQRQSNSYRTQIETLNNEIHRFERTLNDLKEEKNQIIQTKIDGDQDNGRQQLLRQVTQEKSQYEQEIKDCRSQIKQFNHQRQQMQEELDNTSKQLLQIINEKNQLQNEQTRITNELDSSRKQANDKEQRMNELQQELSTLREQHTSTEIRLRQGNDDNDNRKREIERLKSDSIDQINRFEQVKNELKQTIDRQQRLENESKAQLNVIEKAKYDVDQQLQMKQQVLERLQTTLSQLHDKVDQKDNCIERLSTGIRRSLERAHKTAACLQRTVHTTQMNLLTTIEQAEQESQSIRAQAKEQIREEFTQYLTIYHTLFTDNKIKLEKQMEKDNAKLIEQQQQLEKQMNKIKHEHEKLTEEHRGQKQKYEIRLGELNNNLSQVSESLSQATLKLDLQRQKYEPQITSLERELESRTKKHDMQLSALRENLATVRTELKTNKEKIANLEHIKAEKADTDARLMVSQEERRALLERSLASESKNDKLVFENGQLTKKNIDMEAALQEIARESQALQIQVNKTSQRRWLNDDDVRSCMNCHQTFSVTQRKHHCRSCGNIFCDTCSSKTAVVAASSKKPQRVCDPCYRDLTS